MELEVLKFFQGLGCGFFDVVFSGITILGELFIYIALIPILYWCVDKYLGEHLTVSLISGSYVNYLLKGVFARVRPIGRDGIRRAKFDYVYESLKGENGMYLPESFPSGHTQGSASFFSAIAYKKGFKRFYWLLLIPVLIGYSRIYLGVHWPSDVLFALLEGFLISALLHYCMTKCKKKTLIILPVVATPFLAFAINVNSEHMTKLLMLLGLLWGACFGILVENSAVGFKTNELKLWVRIVRFPVGIIAVAVCAAIIFLPLWLIGVDMMFVLLPASIAASFAMTAIAPLVFKRLGLN